MKNNYLMMDAFKHYPKKSNNYFFVDEFKSHFYLNKKKNLDNFYLDFNFLSKINIYSDYVLKKKKNYLKQFAKIFNIIHNKNYSIKFWGLLFEQFLFLIINSLYIEKLKLSKIYKQNKNIRINKINFNKTFKNTEEFLTNNNKTEYLKYVVAKKIGFREEKFSLKNYDKFNFKKLSNENFIENSIRFLTHIYIKIFNPTILIDAYINKKDIFKLFILSFGKILCTKKNFFFKKIKFYKKNLKIREKIKIKEKDEIDVLFNILIKDFLPLSYLENFKDYEKFNEKFKNLKKIGSAVNLLYNDNYKFLAASLLEKKKNVITLPHGGFLGKHVYNQDNHYIEKKYSTKYFRWGGHNSISYNFLSYFKLFEFDRILTNKDILFYPTNTQRNDNYRMPLLKRYHPNLHCYLDIYNNLSSELKKNVRIKLFPDYNSKHFKLCWPSKNNKNFFVKKSNELFFNSRLVIINDYSTPMCELLSSGTPFIIVDSEKKYFKDKNFINFKKLKEINIFFDNHKSASYFINKNYQSLDLWWKKVINSNIYFKLKKKLIPNKTNLFNLVNELR